MKYRYFTNKSGFSDGSLYIAARSDGVNRDGYIMGLGRTGAFARRPGPSPTRSWPLVDLIKRVEDDTFIELTVDQAIEMDKQAYRKGEFEMPDHGALPGSDRPVSVNDIIWTYDNAGKGYTAKVLGIAGDYSEWLTVKPCNKDGSKIYPAQTPVVVHKLRTSKYTPKSFPKPYANGFERNDGRVVLSLDKVTARLLFAIIGRTITRDKVADRIQPLYCALRNALSARCSIPYAYDAKIPKIELTEAVLPESWKE